MDKELFKDRIKIDEPNDQQKVRLYEKFKGQQESQFELYINYINEILCVLKHYRIVSDFTKFTARIKSTERAIENDSIKSLDDVFGIEVDFATPGEKAFVSEIIKSTLKVRKEKIHNKENGYQAYHVLGYPTEESNLIENFEKILSITIDQKEKINNYYESLPKNKVSKELEKKDSIQYYFNNFKSDFELYARSIENRMSEKHLSQLKKDLELVEKNYMEKQKNEAFGEENSPNIPVIEFQSKTIQAAIEANIGRASHGTYKGIDSKKVQEEYDKNDGKIALSRIPTMYSSNLEIDSDGKIIPPELLSSDATLRSVYRELITKNYEIRGEGR